MPELPEVETIRRALEPRVRNRTVVDAWAFASTKFAPARDVLGATIESLRRRGKYLLLALDDNRELVLHLGMTGRLGFDLARDRYTRASWTFDDASTLTFRDVRRFGRVAVVPHDNYRSLPTLHALGPEPFDPAWTAPQFHAALQRSSRAIKTQLLSQLPVAGVGNIYADEALWVARVHPATRRLNRRQAALLHDAVIEVLADALAHDGTTLRDYRTATGGTGAHQHHLHSYGRAGAPCERCGAPLRALRIDGRTSTFCARCQRAPRARRSPQAG